MGEFWSTPRKTVGPQNDGPGEGVVIIGGGAIGLPTAYSLALALKEATQSSTSQHHPRNPKITIVESSDRLYPVASNQAAGGLGDFGFVTNRTGVAGVASLSYKPWEMDVNMAAIYNGREAYGFSEQLVYCLTPKGFTGTPKARDDWGSALPPWVKISDDWEAQSLSSGTKGAHLDPKHFCLFLSKRVKEAGVEFELSANVTSVQLYHDKERFSSVKIKSPCGTSHVVPGNAVILVAGPWSDRIFSQLFPDANIKLPMNSTYAAGNHFRIKILGWKEDDKGNSEFDVTSFTNGDLYIGGWGATPEEIPELATSIQAQPSEVKAMFQAVKQFVTVDPDEELEYYDAGRCYRPTAMPNRSSITKVDWSLLSKNVPALAPPPSTILEDALIAGGLYINTGHSSDGITLGLGSGEVAGELVLGKTPSVDISSLGLPEARL